MTCVLAIDQGTTSARAIVFDADLHPCASAKEEVQPGLRGKGRVYPDADGFREWALDRSFSPAMADADRQIRYDAWRRAVKATMRLGDKPAP